MPKELRKLVFTKDELRRAAYDYCLRANVPVPQAAIEGMETGQDPAAALTLKFNTMHPADPKEVVLSRDQVGAALIRYCMDNKVPLPRNAQKVLQVQDDGEIALLVNIHRSPPKPES